MLKLFTCTQGHFWEATTDGEDPGGPPPPCPECGAPPESLPFLDLLPPEEAPEGPAEDGPAETAVTADVPEVEPVSVQVTATALAPRAEDLPLTDDRAWPVVAGFEILKDLGRGPTRVRNYRARQVLVNRTVLLRVVLGREDPNQSAWGTLRAEASALGRLHHPHIVAIHEAGERNRQLFYNAVEDVPGPTLAEELAERPLPVPQALALVEALARAIQHAHEEDIIHRNLKPGCVLLARQGEPKGTPTLPPPLCRVHNKVVVPRLTGFGLTRRAVEGDVIDHGLFTDEEGYLSPEQVWGRARDLGPATDVYGLGGILFFSLTARPPYRGADTSDVLDTIQSADVPSPSQFRSGVSAELDAVCRKCLAKNPRRRYASAQEVAEEFGRLRHGLPVRARHLGALARLRKWAGRRPALAALLLLLCLFLPALLIAHSLGEGDRPGRGTGGGYPQPFPQPRDNAELLRLRAEVQRYQEKERAEHYRQRLTEVREALSRNDFFRARTLLRQCDPDQRHWEWHYYDQQASRRAPLAFVNISRPVTAVAFANGFVAAAGEKQTGPNTQRGDVRIWNLATQIEVLHREDLAGPVRALALDKLGQQIATVSPRDPPARGAEVRSWPFGRPQPGGPTVQAGLSLNITDIVHPQDGLGWLVVEQNGFLRRIHSRSGHISNPFIKLNFVGGMTTRLALSPNGLRVATLTIPGNALEVFPTRGGRLTHRFNVTNPQALCFVGDNRLAVSLADLSIRIYSLDAPGGGGFNPGPEATLVGHKGVVRHLDASPDGKRLASSAADGVKVWDVDLSQDLVTLTGFGTQAPPVAFSPGGKALAIGGDKGVIVWGNPRE